MNSQTILDFNGGLSFATLYNSLHFGVSLSPKQDSSLPEDKDLKPFKLHSRNPYKWRAPVLGLPTDDQQPPNVASVFLLATPGTASLPHHSVGISDGWFL